MPDSQIDDIEFKAAPAGQVSVNDSKGIVECFVAGIGNKDSVGDICAPGAFNGSLKRRKPRVVWGHNWNDPIGKVLEIYEVPPSDPRLPEKMKRAGIGGLYAKVQFNLNSEKGREAFANVQFFGLEQEWSIGYKTLDAVFDPSKQANVLKEVELYEVSPVLHGANQLTGTISIKQAKLRDPKGGLTAAGRRHFKRTEGANLKPGVRGAADTPQKMRRKGSFLTRFFTNPSGPMKKPNGKPTRLALSAAAWGEPVPQNRSDAAKLAAKGRRMLERYENSKKKDAQWEEDFDFSDYEMFFEEEFTEMALDEVKSQSEEELWDSVDFDDFDEKGHMMMRMVPVRKPEPRRDIFAEGEAQPLNAEKRNSLEMEIASRVQAPIKLMSATENIVIFAKMKEGMKKYYRLPYHWDQETQQYMFGKPERVVPQMTFQPMSTVVPSQMPAMPMQVKPNQSTSRAYAGGQEEPTMAAIFEPREKYYDDEEKSLAYMTSMSGFDEEEQNIIIECDSSQAFRVKSELDPIFEYHNAEVEVTEFGIKVLSGATEEFLEAVYTASKNIFGGGSKKALRSLRAATQRFDPNAVDGDNDGLVQEGSPFERPATPKTPKLPSAPSVRQAGSETTTDTGIRSMRSNSYKQRLERMNFEEVQTEAKEAIEEIDKIVEDMMDRSGKSYEDLWAMSLLEMEQGRSNLDLAKSILSNRMGADKVTDEDAQRLVDDYESWFIGALGDLNEAEDRLSTIDDHIADFADYGETVEQKLEDLAEERRYTDGEIDKTARRLGMTREDYRALKNAEDREAAGDKYLRDNFDADEIEDEEYAFYMQSLIEEMNDADEFDLQERLLREDEEWFNSRSVLTPDEIRKFRFDTTQGRDENPYNSYDKTKKLRDGVNAAWESIKGPKKGGMRSTRKNNDEIELVAPARNRIAYADTLQDFADNANIDRTLSDALRELGSQIDPETGPSIVNRSNLQIAIDAVTSRIGDDESGKLLELSDFLSRMKNGAKNNRWVDGNLDPDRQKLNTMGPRSNPGIPDNGISLKLTPDERGDIRRVLEKEKGNSQGIAAFAEFDKWLQGNSDKMPADVARRIQSGLNEFAKRNEAGEINPVMRAAKDVIDLAALSPNATYESPNLKKGGGFNNRRPAPMGLTRRNMGELLRWGQSDGQPEVRDRFAGLEVDDISPKGWAILQNSRSSSMSGLRSERDDGGSGRPTVSAETRDTGKERQRGRPMGTIQEDGRFKGKKWEDIKPEGWDDLPADQQFDDLYAFYHPNKSGMREVDFQRLSKEISKRIEDEERRAARRNRRSQIAQELADGTREAPSRPATTRREGDGDAPEEEDAPEMTAEQWSARRRRDLNKVDKRVAGNQTRTSEAVADGDASEEHREVWDSLSDIVSEGDEVTMSMLESVQSILDDYMEQFQGEDLTAKESASMQAARSLKNTVDEMVDLYKGTDVIEQGDTSVGGGFGGVDENDIPNSGVSAARFLSEGGMRSFRNYQPSAIVNDYAENRISGGMRSERAGRTQIIEEATFFKKVEDSLAKEIREARSANDRTTADALTLLQRIMGRQDAGKISDRRTNVGTITVTQDEVDQIMDALMVVVDRQMETGGSRVEMFSRLIDLFAEAAMGTFIMGTTEEITSRSQQRTNSQGRTVNIPNN